MARVDPSKPGIVTLELSDDQWRALASPQLDRRRSRVVAIWLSVALGLLIIGGGLPRSPGGAQLIGWIVVGAAVLGAVLSIGVHRSHRARSGSRAVTRAIGKMPIVLQQDDEWGRSLTYVELGPEDLLLLDGEVPGPATIGGVEYTTRGRLPTAVWDIDGSLLWHAGDYRPTDTAPKVLGLGTLERA